MLPVTAWQPCSGDLLIANNDTEVEFLKMDIEGEEHTSLIPFLQKFEVCQVSLLLPYLIMLGSVGNNTELVSSSLMS